MTITLRWADRRWSADPAGAARWSTPLDPYGPHPNAFGLPAVSAAPFEAGGFVGDTRRGGSVNCEVVTLAPHGNGTHTECVGHIVDDRVSIDATLSEPFVVARLVTVTPTTLGASGEAYAAPHADHDVVISAAGLAAALDGQTLPPALAIRTTSPADKRTRVWSGTNPCYLTNDAARWLVTHDVRHVLLDVPSIDREEDAGLLPNHHTFWGVPGDSRRLADVARPGATITEMFDAPASCPDGLYLLFLQIPPLALDAAPSRVLACPLTPADPA